MVDWVKLQAVELGKKVGCRFIIVQSERDKVKMYQTQFDFELIPPGNNGPKQFLMYYNLGSKS